jgi:signal transduction histidine kinase
VLPQIFEAFWRGPRPSGHRGLGLGLFIAREIVRAHGGALHVSSGPEPRTVFSIRLPRG